MLPREIIAKFCDPQDIRLYCHKPVALDERTMIASNGHILIVTELDNTIELNNVDQLVGRSAQLREEYAEHVDEMSFRPVSAIELPTPEPCQWCSDGTVIACKHCGGDGEDHLGHDCKRCNGTGISNDGDGDVVTCSACEGTAHELTQPVPVGDALFSRRYLALLQEIEGCELATNPGNPARGTGYFRFPGGYGFIMPCRP